MLTTESGSTISVNPVPQKASYSITCKEEGKFISRKKEHSLNISLGMVLTVSGSVTLTRDVHRQKHPTP